MIYNIENRKSVCPIADYPHQVPNMKQRPHSHLPSLPKPRSAVQRRPRVSQVLAPLATLALILTLTAIACAEQDARITFISDRDGNEEIYVMNADGSDVTRLTHTDGHIVGYPTWSPDGRRIAFSSDQGGNQEIYVMNADGSDLTQLTHSDRDHSGPAWSPDGQRIAFASGRHGDSSSYMASRYGSDITQLTGNFDIYIMNADGSGLTQLTNGAGSDLRPSWSPDGRRIVFQSDRDGDPDIYIINADGSGLTQLTHNVRLDFLYGWLPDGQSSMFSSIYSNMDEVRFVMNADGSGMTRLLPSLPYNVEFDFYHSFPILSPDGRHVERTVLFADRDGDDEMYITDADGSDLMQLTVADTYRGARDEDPIVFSTTTYDADGDDEIYLMNRDGSGLVQLTDNTSRDFAPHLAPTP